MSSKLKTALVGGTIALAITIFAVGAAHAGGRHHLPFAPFGTYLPSSYDDDYCDDCAYGYGYGYSAEDRALSTARRVTRDALGVDVRDVVDAIAE